jgi:sn-1 stearoyl-lipid 9-desaturase
MSFIEKILRPPAYGWTNSENQFVRPTKKQIFQEFFSRLNLFKSKKNWLAVMSWGGMLLLLPFVIIFAVKYFSIALVITGFIYGMVIMGSHGTIWYHRYSTHHAYKFKHKFWRFLTSNLVPKMIPEEIYVISHHVHHSKSDKAGDPYNANGGWLYCFLADVNHQPIALDLSEENYNRATHLMKHTGVRCNTYEQYKRWGSVSHPLNTVVGTLLNYAFWGTVFYLIGGPAIMCALLGGAFLALGVRTFNYDGHGRGKDKRTEGKDFNTKDCSINQYWPGIVAGEWHSNHHLFPHSARAGFLKYQIDFAWYYIYVLKKLGAVTAVHNSKKRFDELYYKPYLAKVKKKIVGEAPVNLVLDKRNVNA